VKDFQRNRFSALSVNGRIHCCEGAMPTWSEIRKAGGGGGVFNLESTYRNLSGLSSQKVEEICGSV
jgi:hypothetical protein